MSLLIDSGVWIAFYNERDEHHKKAVEIMKEIDASKYGSLISTDYILDETVTHCLIHYSPDKSLLVGEAILSTTDMIQITKDIVEKSWDLFKVDKQSRGNGRFLSFTDCASIITAKMFKINYIVTFDSRFRKYINVLDI